jgi:hypothetical protein
MVARKKRKKSKTKRISFQPSTSKRKKLNRTGWIGPSLFKILKVLAVICVCAGLVIGFIYLERYVKNTTPTSTGTIVLELADVPVWVNDQLKSEILTAARNSSEDLKIDENTAFLVQRSIEKEIVWLDDVKVQTTHEGLRIEGRWRKPVALIKSGIRRFYVDAEQVVLDFIEMPNLPTVRIAGLSVRTKVPPLGEVWGREDVAAAILILDRFGQMDKLVTPDKPLLAEIDRIDVSNFNGRLSDRSPHIILYTKDNTQIIWGAEVGKWQRYLESTDEQKLAKLYGYYKEYGTLSGGVKYINLRDPQNDIPLPVDKY